MTQRLPKFRPRNSEVVDVDDYNRALLPFAEEASGKLGEHNFADQTTAGNAIQRGDVGQNAGFRWRQTEHTQDQLTGTTGTRFEIIRAPYWRTVTSATVSWTGPAGKFWIIASWQLFPQTINLVPGNGPMFAIRVNGTVIPESIVGTAEMDNDPLGGLLWGCWPHAVDTIVDIPEGENTVELVVRTMRDNTSGIRDIVANRELIILQQTR